MGNSIICDFRLGEGQRVGQAIARRIRGIDEMGGGQLSYQIMQLARGAGRGMEQRYGRIFALSGIPKMYLAGCGLDIAFLYLQNFLPNILSSQADKIKSAAFFPVCWKSRLPALPVHYLTSKLYRRMIKTELQFLLV